MAFVGLRYFRLDALSDVQFDALPRQRTSIPRPAIIALLQDSINSTDRQTLRHYMTTGTTEMRLPLPEQGRSNSTAMV